MPAGPDQNPPRPRSWSEEVAEQQRIGARGLSLEERFRQNDSMSRLRSEALKSAKQDR